MLAVDDDTDPWDDATSYITISRSQTGDLDTSAAIKVPELEDLPGRKWSVRSASGSNVSEMSEPGADMCSPTSVLTSARFLTVKALTLATLITVSATK